MTGEQVFEFLSKLSAEQRQLPFIMRYVNERDEPDTTRRTEIETIGVERWGVEQRQGIVVE